MCKINGHSIFSYMFQPVWNWSKLYNSKRKEAEAQAVKKEEVPEVANNDDVNAKTASTATINNKDKQNRPLSSLRIPLNTSNTGASLGGQSSVGLNLGGG